MKRRRIWFTAALLLLTGTMASADSPQGFRTYGETVSFPASVAGGSATAAVRRHQAAVASHPTAAGYRRLAEACEAARLYQQAADACRKESVFRRKLGDVNGAKIEENKANWLDSRIEIYRELPASGITRNPAKFEPASGCYIGAIVEHDPRCPKDYEGFNRLIGKQHALFFDYRTYGMPFPAEWAEKLKAAGAAAQIAFEPTQGLDAVQDDAYLQGFARDAAASGIPVFLRFAGEMNGDWTAYGRQPAEFIRKWRLVYRVMRRLAPNVAMVWTPNAIPEYNIPQYYPGDAYVDWVGINFYTVHHHDNQLSRPALREDPADTLNFIYRHYAARKPIMICEYAATHYCKADRKLVAQFASDKLQMLYAALPRRYPRVKAIHWYDINNAEWALRAGRDTNDYSLTNNSAVLNAYRAAINSSYFLSSVQRGGFQEDAVRFSPLTAGKPLSGTVRLSAWAKTNTDRPVVGYRLDGKAQLATASRPYAVEWDTRRVSNGAHTLEALVFVNGRVMTQRRITVRVAN